MKKTLSILLSLCLLLSVLSGCTQNKKNVESEGKIDVVSTIFAPYDFVKQIVGDKAEVTMLLPPGSEGHSYEPTPQDIIKIQNCDVFIHIGGEFDTWVQEVLKSIDTSKMKIITLMDCVDVVEKEIIEGMEDDHGHSHGDEEFDPSNVRDRPMSDFDGDWISGIPLLNDGSLDKYIEHSAEENGVSFNERKEALLTRWASAYNNITIKGNSLTMGGNSADYEYKGYRIVESDHGTSVWYNYQISAPVQGMPVYITFNDHSYGDEEHHEHHHEREHEEIGHYHLKYGDESFDVLIDNEDWATFYFDASHSNSEIGEFMADHEHDAEFDEHVWTSPKNAKIIVQKISDVLCEVDAANADSYKENTISYLTQLSDLDEKFQEVVDSAAHKTMIFGDRFPFRYFADAYGLEYFAAFPGCSAETEASAATVAFLIDKVRDEGIPAVFHVELSNKKMANTISEETNAKVLLFHACHNVTKAEMANGITYIDLMNQNVKNLEEALK